MGWLTMWTAADDWRLIRMHYQLSVDDLAIALFRSKSGVKERIKMIKQQAPLLIYHCACGANFGWAGDWNDQMSARCPVCGNREHDHLSMEYWEKG